jgi:Rha family phage regulatory protein
MASLILHPDYLLYERKDTPFCSSLQVAQEFEKRHDAVLRDIRSLDCSDEFRLLNFVGTSQMVDMPHGGTRREPIFLMTKDGFVFLVMGYRGKKAAAIKEAYIKRFNGMERYIKQYIAVRDDNPIFTQAIMDAHLLPKSYHYSNEYDMINKIVLGCTARQFRLAHDIQDNQSIRPYLPVDKVKAIRTLQREDVRLLYRSVQFQERKILLADKYIHEIKQLEE